MRCAKKRKSGCRNYFKKNWVAENGLQLLQKECGTLEDILVKTDHLL